jgi:acyl transferase domain-containing protein/acyl carrier protein
VAVQRRGPAKPAAEPIAVVGMACRLPQAAGVAEFWDLIREGRDAIVEVPRDRFDVDAYYSAQPATPGRISSRWGGFVEHIADFDAAFFGVSPREAAHLDPQQRLLLETAWEAIQDAGWVPDERTAARTGVFVGQLSGNYWDLLRGAGALDIYANVGTSRASQAARLCYAFDLRGPSVSVDAASSSSLVAVHLACQSLRSGESEVALAGGVNVILQPDETVTFSQADMLAADGRCKFASADADGFVRSEGVGILVLKPLSLARRDGDLVRALIHGSAVRTDGQASGALMTPAEDGQILTLRAAYAGAGLDPARVDYVEAHGTGTRIGDKVELTALTAVLGEGRPADRPLLVGSVKTNIGHTESAAGVAGLIKTVLCLEHRLIPGSLHGTVPTEAVDWAKAPITVPQRETPWPARTGPALAGVSSFGLSGTNAHCVVGEYVPEPTPAAEPAAATPGRPRLLTLSARDPRALRELATRYATRLDALDPADPAALRDLCHSAATRRAHLRHRLTAVGNDAPQLAAKLRAFVAEEAVTGLGSSEPLPEGPPAVVFVFPGQGSQWIGMGRDLIARSSVFRETIEACAVAISAETGWSLFDVLEGRHPLEGADVIQPTIWAMEIGLAALWRSWGVHPDYVLGHSMGESAAAYVAGALTLPESAAVICRRSALALTVSGAGAMASVELTAEQAAQEISEVRDVVSIAAINSPTSTVLSGDPLVLKELVARLEARDVFGRMIQVDFASHSPQMDVLTDPLIRGLDALAPQAGTVPVYSTVLGEPIDGSTMDATYWARNLREPVGFGPAVAKLIEQGPVVFIEMSPHPILLNGIGEYLAATEARGHAVPSLRRDEPELATVLDALGAAHRHGVRVDWQAVEEPGARAVRLPAYPWQRKRYWFADNAAPKPAEPAAIDTPDLDTLIYKIEWHPVERAQTAAPNGYRLVFRGSDAVGHDLVATSPWPTATVIPGPAFERIAAGEYRIDPGSPEDYRRLLAALREDLPGQPCAGIVHLWSLETAGVADPGIADLEAAVRLGCGSALLLAQALEDARPEPAPRLWLVTRGAQAADDPNDVGADPAQAALWGFGRTLAEELPELAVTLLDLPAHPVTHELLRELADDDRSENQLALRGGRRLAARLVRHAATAGNTASPSHALAAHLPGKPGLHEVASAALSGEPGLYGVDSARVASADPSGAPGPHEVDVAPSHIGLPGRDSGWTGGVGQCSGRITAVGSAVAGLAPGDEVLALVPGRLRSGALPARVRTEAGLAVRRPSTVSAREAATLPLAFLTAYHGLCEVGGLGEGESVLIDEAADSVGLAAVQLARWRRARVYASAADPGDRAYLRMLGVEGIVGAPAPGFADELPPRRLGEGFDVIVTRAGSGELDACLAALAPGGRLVVVGEAGTTGLTPPAVPGNRSIAVVDPAELLVRQSRRAYVALREAVNLAGAGLVGPLPHVQIEAAPGTAVPTQAAHTTTVVALHQNPVTPTRAVHMTTHMTTVVVLDQNTVTPARGAVSVRGDGTYVVTGGLGALGRLTVQWLVDHGARDVLILGRSSLSSDSPDAAKVEAVGRWERAGIRIDYRSLDAADAAGIRQVLDERRRAGSPPVRGAVHAAGIVRYLSVGEMTSRELDELLRVKLIGGWALHEALRDEPVDFFVLYSSLAALMRSPRMAGYAAANAALDALAAYRRARGLSALSIGWGVWGEVGMAAEYERESGRPFARDGMSAFSPKLGIAALERLVAEDATHAVVLAADWPRWAAANEDAAVDPLLRELVAAAPTRGGGSPAVEPGAVATPEPARSGASVSAQSTTSASARSAVSAPARSAASALEPSAASAPAIPEPAVAPIPIVIPIPAPAPATAATPDPVAPADSSPEEISAFIATEVARVLGLSVQTLDRREPLQGQGLDSLMAAEVRRGVKRRFGVLIPLTKLLRGHSVDDLAGEVAKGLAPVAG